MSSKPVSLNLSSEALELLDAAAAVEGRSRSGLANRLILAALDPQPHASLGAAVASVGGVVPARGTDLSSVKPDPK